VEKGHRSQFYQNRTSGGSLDNQMIRRLGRQ
jgi:hypothetical protein